MIRRLLIANRGEIAVRIARTARELGIGTVAVFSDADRAALHVRCCDEAIRIGPPAAFESYLSIPAIVAAAREASCDAVHPGYGFLSENPRFARAVEAAGLTWIGPEPGSMETMGDKTAARRRMAESGVPVVPGFDGGDAAPEVFASEAQAIGYPVLVKAAAGGGGKGMRLVDAGAGLAAALDAARREAAAAFGDGRVYLEKAIGRPRHVEFQIFGDASGNIVSLFERECSIQRRHQKVLEETPSPALDQETRARMAQAAVAAGRAVGYRGAGTVEFLLDPERRFYFLEMNTRLQVEHAITEEVLGVDLVAAQIAIAQGRNLPAAWKDLSPRGHAIECRVYAEDPETGLPQSGRILVCEEPRGPGVRVDSGVDAGSEVGIDYDPLLAKVVVHGSDRPCAIAKMKRALAEYVLLGVTTNVPLLRRIVDSAAFTAGETDTGFLSRMPDAARAELPPAAAAAAAWALAPGGSLRSAGRAQPADPWSGTSGWRMA